jgi:hypothetical protein
MHICSWLRSPCAVLLVFWGMCWIESGSSDGELRACGGLAGGAAHVDHGKSTLADRLLEVTNTIGSGGRSQVLDKLQVERERGITVKAQTATLLYTHQQRRYVLNLIDTPGATSRRPTPTPRSCVWWSGCLQGRWLHQPAECSGCVDVQGTWTSAMRSAGRWRRVKAHCC